MAVVYFDASALIKLLIDEDGSELVVDLWDGCDAPLSSRLAYPEVRAALAALGRNRAISRAGLASAERTWEEFWGATRPVELTPAIGEVAGDLAGTHGLRGADAVHLASALAVESAGLIVAVWDRRLHAGAVAAELAVAPARLDD